jgi:hypothetical protein
MQPSHCQRGFAHEGEKNNEAERPNPRHLGRVAYMRAWEKHPPRSTLWGLRRWVRFFL